MGGVGGVGDGLKGACPVTDLARLGGALCGAVLSLEMVSTKDSSPLSQFLMPFPRPSGPPLGRASPGAGAKQPSRKCMPGVWVQLPLLVSKTKVFSLKKRGAPGLLRRGNLAFLLWDWEIVINLFFQVTLPCGVHS